MTSTWIPGLRPDPHQPVPERISPPELIEAAEREIGVQATWWAAQTAQRIVDEVTTRFRDSESPAMVTGFEREGCEASLLTVLIGLHKQIPSVSRSGSATESVHQSVHRGVAINTVLQTVWTCHALAQDALLTEVEKVVPEQRLVEEVRQLNRAMNGYITSYAGELIREYEEELALWKGRVQAEQLRIFTQLIAGVDPGENAEEILGVRLTDTHLVASVWSRATGHVPDKDGQIASFAHTAGEALGAARTLVLPQDDVTEVWWSWRSAPPSEYVARLRQLTRPTWMHVAVGTPERGAGGVLSSHQACLQAVRVGRRSEVLSLWPYEELRIVALLSADPEAARRFTRAELTGLSDADAKTVTLRETLRVWLQSGGSRTVTAERLFIALNTVSYRVAKASDLLGRPPGERTVETLLALELAHYFPDFLT
ncbi:PucR family transcriptional regulator [Nocardia gipuzkoensis]|uniref:PucR family transcriptional regulator n=1 Tax=Nocardia gipuzkoensis TaxID=2749991 RepID=UPI0015EEBC0E|nr:PucR family transcriptional regulator [Nocardia gipuzkoensis]